MGILSGLTEQLENVHDARILSPEGHMMGKLSVEIWPLAKDGSKGVPDEEVVDDLLGTRMPILVRVVRATGLPEGLANDVRIEYHYFIDEKPHQVSPVQGWNCNPEFGYEHAFVQDPVTQQFFDYLNTQTMNFFVYGRDVAAEQAVGKLNVATNAAASTP